MTTGRINQVTTDPIRRPMRAVGRTDGRTRGAATAHASVVTTVLPPSRDRRPTADCRGGVTAVRSAVE